MCAENEDMHKEQIKSQQEMYLDILKILRAHEKAHYPFFCPCRLIRSELNTPVDVLRPYAENLEINGYVRKQEGFGRTFLLMITEKGNMALQENKVDIVKKCRYYSAHKIRVLEFLKKEHDLGKDTFFIADRKVQKELGYEKKELENIIDELNYCGLINKIGLAAPNCTVQITNKGLMYLKKNRKS